jgi:hypothetical protein
MTANGGSDPVATSGAPASAQTPRPAEPGWREKTRILIFEADTPSGKVFDVVLLCLIGIAVLAVTLESVPEVKAAYGD